MSDKTVLCVDDEVNILNALKRLLRSEDYQLLTAVGGEEGLSVLEQESVHLVISDQRMPGMTGVEFLQRVKERHPDTVRVVLSGYADVSVMVDAINHGEIYRFLAKPWNDAELKTAVRQCLAQYDILQENQALVEKTRVQNEELRRLNEGLEEIIDARTRSLQLSQEILEKLPMPVIGISREGMLALTNQAVRETLPRLRTVPPGTDMREVFPPEVAAVIGARLAGDDRDEAPVFAWNGDDVRMHIETLREAGEVRGCILIMEVTHRE